MSVLHQDDSRTSSRFVTDADRLDYSCTGFALEHPDLSAATGPRTKAALITVAVVLVLAVPAVLAPLATATALCSLILCAYAAVVVHRIVLMMVGATSGALIHVSDADALAVPDHELPVYTVLIPAYGESAVVGDVLAVIDELDYPRHRLDVKLLLEADDTATIDAAIRGGVLTAGPHLTLVLVPAAEPRTKPKACNYGLTLARGELVTIYDAEDRPEPLQLRRAVVAFRRADDRTVCLQARLSYHNSAQNLLTKWFTSEYDSWFAWLLPGLVATGAPIPLGGTSNHLLVDVLTEVGAWDPYNVTEDADLGVRLARHGYSVGVLDSVTHEEANSDFVNWLKQRSRWYKGYLKTWLVHMRHPRLVVRQLGWRGTLGFTLFVAGTPVLALLSPVFWALTALWFLAKPPVLAELFPTPVYHLGMLTWLLGGALLIYAALANARGSGRPELFPALLMLPAYWAMMSVAAVKAVVQLVLQPAYWEKTTHGLDRPATLAVAVADESAA